MVIKLLENDVINKIAAGEVIDRPSSIVKELVENAIDAGADLITVQIQNGGIDEIIIEDNGQGIDFDDLSLAFLRHATSKLDREEDLYTIGTMGFRGEALPSIASIARMEIYTKTPRSDSGSHCVIEGGTITRLERYPTAEGTKLTVKDLFYNTPVRKTFLKSPVSEGNHIYDTVVRYALAYPDISFVFDNHKKTQFKTPGNGSLRDTVFTLFGTDINEFLLDVKEDSDSYILQGLISKPEYKRQNRRQGFFFVNNRPIRSPLLMRAVDHAYRGLLVSKEFPVYFLSLNVPAGSLDVNIHPQKSEVRFQDEQGVFRFISAVLRRYLDDTSFGPGNFLHTGNDFALPPQGSRPYYARAGYSSAPAHLFFEKAIFNESFDPETGEILVKAAELPQIQPTVKQYEDYSVIGQLDRSYILAESSEGLMIIDQHAAHERIWYNRFSRMYEEPDLKQPLVLPLALDFSSEKVVLLEEHLEQISKLGFEIDIIGHNSIMIRAVPHFVAGNELLVLTNILEGLKEGETINLKADILSSMACEKAITAGTSLSMNEMVQLLHDLMTTEDHKNCPHGRPTIINISSDDLERMFKRQK